jgi:hypothetical protein
MAQRLFLRRNPQYSQIHLSVQVVAQLHAKVLDSHRANLPSFQLDLFVVRSRKLMSAPSVGFHSYLRTIQGNFFIAFTVLTNALEDTSYNLKNIHVANVILEYFYVGLVLMCFILALGNRPQGSKWAFTVAFIGFAIVTLYMTVGGKLLLRPRALTPSLVRGNLLGCPRHTGCCQHKWYHSWYFVQQLDL